MFREREQRTTFGLGVFILLQLSVSVAAVHTTHKNIHFSTAAAAALISAGHEASPGLSAA